MWHSLCKNEGYIKYMETKIDERKEGLDNDARTVNILGTEYTIEERILKEDPRLEECEGYCDASIKKIVIKREADGSIMDPGNYDKVKKLTLAHECLHIFLHESGINDNALKGLEELFVEWMALQLPKIVKTFKELGVLE